MKGLKNFIYKTNDIILAIVIIALACGLIMWRMDVIMDYPSTLSDQTSETQAEEQASSSEDKAKSEAAAKEEKEEKQENATDEAKAQKTEDTTGGTFADGKLTKTVKVKVAGASATAAAGCLVDAGLFTSYDDYAKYCKKAGTNPEQIKAGTFSFSAGMTKTAIAKMVTQ